MKDGIFSKDELIKDLKVEAKALEIPSGAADEYIKRVATEVETKLKKKKIITDRDLERVVGAELKKYNADLAYVYQNRDKII